MKRRLLSNVSMLGKLLILSLVVFVGFAAIIFMSLSSFGALRNSVESAYTVNNSLLKASADVERTTSSVQIALYRMINDAAGGSSATKIGTEADSLMKTLDKASDALQELAPLAGSDAAMLKAIDGVSAAFDDYDAYVNQIISFVREDPKLVLSFMDRAEFKFAFLANSVTTMTAQVGDMGKRNAAAAEATAKRGSIGILVVVLAVMLVMALAILALVSSISKPMGGLALFLEKMGKGDFSTAWDSKGKDEVGRIGASADALAADLRDLIGTVKARVESLGETGTNLSANMEETGAAVVQINSNISSTNLKLREQSAAVGEVSAAIEQLTRSVDALSTMIGSQSGVVSQSAASVEEMIANIDSVADSVETAAEASSRLIAEGADGRTRVDEVGESVKAIVRYSENLTEATRMIKELAEKTNLLAMNAAIEAAHAGEAGRGFAVVADEIRKLAEQASVQAKDIAGDLERVSESIEQVRGSSVGVVSAFTSILEKSGSLGNEVGRISVSMAEQREGGKQVLEGLSRLKDITREIGTSAGEMTAGNATILAQVESLKSVNQTVVQNNEEITQGTKEINEAVMATVELASKNGSLIEEVHASVGRFVI